MHIACTYIYCESIVTKVCGAQFDEVAYVTVQTESSCDFEKFTLAHFALISFCSLHRIYGRLGTIFKIVQIVCSPLTAYPLAAYKQKALPSYMQFADFVTVCFSIRSFLRRFMDEAIEEHAV